MASIQFRGVGDSLSGFDDMGCEYWAIFEGKYLRFKGEGSDSLKKTLTTLKKSYSEATYTLCGYTDLEKKSKITLNTPCDGSFNFKLYSDDDTSERNPRRIEIDERRIAMTERISGIEQKLDMLLSEPEDEPEPEKPRMGIIGELMESPLGPVISNILQSWFTPQAAAAAAAIGNFPPGIHKAVINQTTASTTTNDDTAGVVARLIAHDPKMPERLRMLLELADTDKPMFNMVMAQFDKLK